MKTALLVVCLVLVVGCSDTPAPAPKRPGKAVAAKKTAPAAPAVNPALIDVDTKSARFRELYREEMFKDPGMAFMRASMRYQDEKASYLPTLPTFRETFLVVVILAQTAAIIFLLRRKPPQVRAVA